MKIQFEYKNKKIEGELIRRKRKSMCLRITEKGILEVIVPLNISSEFIDQFLIEKAEWIIDKMDEMNKINNSAPKRGFNEGNSFMYLGDEYKVKVVIIKELKNIVISFSSDEKCVYIKGSKFNEYEFYDALEKWYRNETLRITQERVAYYSRYFKYKVNGIRVKEQKRRWASINVHNIIYFNWRISMAPLEVIDYIVVHEMCHMDFRNHSKDFWSRVSEVLPYYKIYHRYLKEHGREINI